VPGKKKKKKKKKQRPEGKKRAKKEKGGKSPLDSYLVEKGGELVSQIQRVKKGKSDHSFLAKNKKSPKGKKKI